jgi:hypothetical protein
MCYNEPLVVRFVLSTCHLCFLFVTNLPPPPSGAQNSPLRGMGGGRGFFLSLYDFY